jgi:AraC-like DNA-binding protein
MMIPDDTRSIPEHAAAFIGGIPDAALPVDDLALRQLLLDVAAAWGASLHEHAHAGSSKRSCSFDVTRTLVPLVGASPHGAKPRFLEWARAFSVEFSRSHPVSAARRAAAIIRERRGARIDTAALADQIGVSPQQLRREFRQTFGVTIGRHERHARLLRALQILRRQPIKIEPVALEAGYASKKSFYEVFKRTVGMTPTEFQRLPHERAGALLSDFELTLSFELRTLRFPSVRASSRSTRCSARRSSSPPSSAARS